jgi:hypothetical protein
VFCGVPLRSTPPSAGESNLPAPESFQHHSEVFEPVSGRPCGSQSKWNASVGSNSHPKHPPTPKWQLGLAFISIVIFGALSLHRKLPFPAPAAETGSMTG